MALSKQVPLPGSSWAFNHFKIGKIVNLDEDAKDAKLWIFGYGDKDDLRGVHAGVMDFRGAAFDRYFSRDALVAAATRGKSIHAVAYQAIRDWCAAEVAKRTLDVVKAQYEGAMETFNDAARKFANELLEWKALVRTLPPDKAPPEPIPPTRPAALDLVPLTEDQVMLTTFASISGTIDGTIYHTATDA